MNFYFYSPVHFEKWDFRNSVEKGIGGSETSHVEMVWRLARRGHKVISYAPISKDCPREWRKTTWIDFEKVDFSQPGIWVIYRSPETLDHFKKSHPHQQIWLMMQDESYPTWTEERAKKVDKILALCMTHKNATIARYPYLKEKVIITGNGVKMDLIREVEQEKIKRNPKKLIYASSPDRGLLYLLQTFKKVRQFIPDLQLHVFYGFNNIDKLVKFSPQFSYFIDIKKNIEELLKQPGVFWRGRISQRELYKEWLSAGLWCYQTNFTETSCITSMEAQALGAIPITNPLWALKDNVMHGSFINGDAYNDPLTKSRYLGEIIRWATNEKLQEDTRSLMMEQARNRFNWERIVDQWESWIFPQFITGGMVISQFNFQLKFSKGKILNVGCDTDPAHLHALGAVNVDIVKESPILKQKTKADIIADARDLPSSLYGKFDSAILGDILEHMNDEDIVKTLISVKKCLNKDGHIVITCPNDHRPVSIQHKMQGNKGYADNISSYHERPIPKEKIEELIDKAGLKVFLYQEIDYTMFMGHGIICC